MKIWYLDDPECLARERAAIESLVKSSDWVVGHSWSLREEGMVLEVDLAVKGVTYLLVMRYPTTYPHTPPAVKPRNPKENLSAHQYNDGTLCLEWGPDNWTTDLTGADLLRSAYKLLDTENPRGEGEKSIVPSRHKLTAGQELRGHAMRLFVDRTLADFFRRLVPGSQGEIEYLTLFSGGPSYTVFIQSMTSGRGDKWKAENLPNNLGDRVQSAKGQGTFLRLTGSATEIASFTTVSDLEPLVKLAKGSEGSVTSGYFLLVGEDGAACLYIISEEGKVYHSKMVVDEAEATRSPLAADLAGKSAAIIGLGSVGGKIAISLARSGLGSAILVDDDIDLPGNLVRHPTDWTNVGQHKVDAISGIVCSIRSTVKTEIFRSNLGKQESNTHLNNLLEAIGSCDIIIDATASPRVFNLLCAVSAAHGKPLVWAEVFAGGIGGLIARSRYGIDPNPQTMRGRFLAYTVNTPKITTGPSFDYATMEEDGRVMVATDSDVGIIANWATNLSIDTLLNADHSKFPCSMYLIGLSKGWVFSGPFDTIPLDVGAASAEGNITTRTETVESNITFLKTLLSDNDTSTGTAA